MSKGRMGFFILVFSGSFEIHCYPLGLEWRELLPGIWRACFNNLHENGGVSDALFHRNGWFQRYIRFLQKLCVNLLIKFKTLVLLVALISTSALLY